MGAEGHPRGQTLDIHRLRSTTGLTATFSGVNPLRFIAIIAPKEWRRSGCAGSKSADTASAPTADGDYGQSGAAGFVRNGGRRIDAISIISSPRYRRVRPLGGEWTDIDNK